jgi:hypothetical protein
VLRVLASAKIRCKVRVAAVAIGSITLTAAAMVHVAAAGVMATMHPVPFRMLRSVRLVAVTCWLRAADLVFWAATAIHAAMVAAGKGRHSAFIVDESRCCQLDTLCRWLRCNLCNSSHAILHTCGCGCQNQGRHTAGLQTPAGPAMAAALQAP